MRFNLLLSVGLALTLVAAAAAKERVWTDTAGRTMTAEFVRESDGDVTLLRAGKLVTVKLASLSERDQQAVRDLAAGKDVADDPAPAPAAEPKNPFEPAAPSPVPATPAPATTNPFEPTKPAEPAGDPAPAGEPPIPIGKKPVPIVSRIWTDINGQQTTAKFVRVFGSNVVLSRAGKNVTIPFYTLSQADQDHVKELLTSRGQEALIPPPAPVPRLNVPGAEPGPLAGNPNPPPQFVPPTPPPAFDPNAAFEEMRRRQEEARQRAADQAAQSQAAFEAAREQQRQAAEQARAESERRRQEAQQAFEESQKRIADALAANRPPPYQPVPSPGVPSPSAQSAIDRALPHEVIGQCEGCRGTITKSQWDRGKCAHCGITWAYSIDENGNKKYRTGSLDKVFEKAPALLFVVIAVVAVGIGVIGAVVSIIVGIVRSASAPQPPRRY